MKAAITTLGLVLLLASPLLAQPPGPPISPGSSGGSGTVTNTDATCADTQIIRADGASNTATQCSLLTVADTTGNLTGPSGGFSIIGGTGAADTLTLDGSAGTAGAVVIRASGSILVDTASLGYDWLNFRNTGGIGWSATGSTPNETTLTGDVQLVREYGGSAVGTLAQRAGAQAQTFRLYGTADADNTVVTNFARLSLAATDGTMTIAAETAGTAADDQTIAITPAGVGTVKLTAAQLVKSAAPPVTCAAGTEGALYLDSDTHKLCYCNGSAWVLASDDTTGCS